MFGVLFFLFPMEVPCTRRENVSPRLPTTINLIGFTESTKEFTLQTPGQPVLNGLGSLGSPKRSELHVDVVIWAGSMFGPET